MPQTILTKLLIIAIAGTVTVAGAVGLYNIRKGAIEAPAIEETVHTQTAEADISAMAEAHYNNNKDKVTCTKDEFIDYFTKIFKEGHSGLEAARLTVLKYKKAPEVPKQENKVNDQQVKPQDNQIKKEKEVEIKEENKKSDIPTISENQVSENKLTEIDFEIIDTDATTMYASKQVNIRSLPTTDSEKVGVLNQNDKVTVVGYVKSYKGEQVLWYKLKDEDKFIHGNYLVNKPIEVQRVVKKQEQVSKKPEPAPVAQQPVVQQPVPQTPPAPAPQPEPQQEYYEEEQYIEDGWGGNIVDISSEDFSDCIGVEIE